MALGKEFSKKRKNSLPSAAEVALGKEAVRVDVGFFLPSADVTLGKGFTECPICGTRQRNFFQRVLCRMWYSVKPLPSAIGALPSVKALGKEPVCGSGICMRVLTTTTREWMDAHRSMVTHVSTQIN